MFNNLTLQTRLIGSSIFMSLIALTIGLVGWSGNSRLDESLKDVSRNRLPSVLGLWKVNEGQTQIESSERALLNTKLTSEDTKAELTRIEKAWKQIDEGYKQYESTPRDEQEDQLYKQLQVTWAAWKQDHQKFIQLYQKFEKSNIINPFETQIQLIRQGKEDSPEMVKAIQAGNVFNEMHAKSKANRISFEAATKALIEDIKYNEYSAAIAEREAAQAVQETTLWLVLVMVIGFLTIVIFGIYFVAKPLSKSIARAVVVAEQISAGDITSKIDVTSSGNDEISRLLTAFQTMTGNLNSLIRQVQQSGIQVTTSATQIAASGKQLEATMTEQVAATNEVVATSKEIAATSGELVKTMDDVTAMSQATTTAAGNSQKELIRMETTMRQLASATSSISSKLGTISEKANNINSVVTTITKVADQTNLLSLNAAIEAEKAGEYGMGFGVVAREIRRLADQTAVATLDIESMVKEMQSAVSTGVMEMDKFTKEVGNSVENVRNISGQLAQIIQQVQDLAPNFSTVNQGMEAQSIGAGQISEAMVQLSEVSRQTADSLRETNSAIEQLNKAAHNLQHEISRFKVKN